MAASRFFHEDLNMSSIVKQFRAFEDPEPIIEMYFWNCQKLASKMVRGCTWIKDDEKWLS